MKNRNIRFALALAVCLGTSVSVFAQTGATNTPFWAGMKDAASFERAMDARLAHAKATLDKMLLVKGARTTDNTLRPYDDVLLELDTVSSQAQLVQSVHPVEAFRQTAEKVTQKAGAFGTDLSLNRGVYDALAAVDASKADAETQYFLKRTLRDFRLAGVDKDEATRKRIKALRDELVVIGQDFDRNIRTDLRKVTAKDAAELEGLPTDFIARHKPDANGVITLTIDYPDSLPVFSFAKNEDLRKRMYMEYSNRGYPKNIETLDKMIARRAELAALVGYKNWADYITADKMVENATNASQFIDRIVAASGPKADREFEVLLKRKQQDVPGATGVTAWERSYYAELVRKSSYDFDSQSVRPYFAFDRVKQGLFDVTSKLFGVSYRPVNVPTWDKSVEAFEMVENGKVIGRFYLDMHPRKDKYNHAAEFPLRTGATNRQIPEAALVCNLPGGEPGDPGLMTHDDVQTFFHEFGHLVHTLVSGRHQWIGISGINTEQDFVEAPSQMLEEWTWDPTTLQTFAKHYQTNEPIPTTLVTRMRRASEFGKAMTVRQQMVYAKLSLSVYDRDPKSVDTTAMVKDLVNKYTRSPYVEGTHFQTSFGHLDGYSAVYYTYMWSLVIAKDMFSQFDRRDLLAPTVASKYRTDVLAPGGSKPAATLVADFVGRPFSYKAWEDWLNREE
ncbi:MAG TPA: M3 family metallopeptidase, partial [Vicinamibacterales bacterium]|nr:M3 family metallopeptidase [Vicinamibacterales bacterium]